MSTLSVANITDGIDSVETGYVVNGSAKAWVNFNGTGVAAIRDSLNVTSLVDNGAGDYTVSYVDIFTSVGYSYYVTGGGNIFVSSHAAGSISIDNFSIPGTRVDNEQISFGAHGDLA
jgi:hypothetical protein